MNRKIIVQRTMEKLLVGMEGVAGVFLPNRLTVFYAHLYPDDGIPIDQDNIRNNLNYLKDECQVLPLPEALNRLDNNQPLPKRAVAIIVDDATSSFYKTGRKLLAESNLPYTLAVIPGLIKSDDKEHLLARLMRIAGHPYWLSNREMLSKALGWFGDDVKQDNATFESLFLKASQLQEDELEDLLDHIQALDHEFMTWEELRELMTTERVDFSSHTMSHPQLKFTSGSWLEWEFRRSRELLIQNLGVEVTSLVVPYGHPRQLTENVKLTLFKTGYSYMFFTKNGVIGPRSKPFMFPRMPLEDEPWRLHIHSCPAVSSVIYSD